LRCQFAPSPLSLQRKNALPIPRRKFLSSVAGAGILTAAPRFTLAEAQTERATRAMPIPRINDISVIECEPQACALP
jgi:mannonate dehydratase